MSSVRGILNQWQSICFQTLLYIGDVKIKILLQISYWELLKFIEKAGIDVASKLQGYQRKDIKSFAQFLDSVQDSLLTNSKYLYLEVGIHTYTEFFLIEANLFLG